MKIGIGLPATIPGTQGATVIEWARRAEQAQFSSLGIIDRVIYGNYEPMVTLAAAAAVTQRIRLMTSVLLAPLRRTALLAKQAASLDALSNGRLTLAMGIGGREDDFAAAEAPFHRRGRFFEQQIATMRRIWAGEPFREGVSKIGPAPVQKGGPEILIGSYVPVGLARAGRLADGFISGGILDPAVVQGMFRVVEQAWLEAGRPGRPRLVPAFYVGVADGKEDAAERGRAYYRDYYAYMGEGVNGMAQGLPLTAQAVLDKIHAFRDIGADELMLWPTINDLDQVDRIAEIASRA